jgi:hypothetical protein
MKRRLTKKLQRRPCRSVADFEAEHGPLSPEERAWLADPEWMTEDEDDIIIVRRIEATESPIPFEDVLAERGLKCVRFHGRTHLVKSRRAAKKQIN